MFPKMFRILEFYHHIWNHHKKYIQKFTNMFDIGSLICEIDIKIADIWESKQTFAQ